MSKDFKESPAFAEIVDRNGWHDRIELGEVISTILKQSSGEMGWTWIRNTDCKYVDVRVDMRDGGFVILDRNRARISLDKLKWQYGESPSSDSEKTEKS